ncbi:ABC transporter permease [Priestia taiwanensis]|uniref:Spermidine/putrescine ABC transporter permease n=1 Tax=Priestia taiwanensis TaxID=1347902 RepID=A0A917EQ32_9BACI|nr:ABC transporter permease [Priestia taiwanensis]MBM7364065.1 spermidine/putrescine transport system permease protein [Priestia taiwanensis]GGE71344.1 spermidine/putrescine ABC transporter permease [Priestia taiwanensis]
MSKKLLLGYVAAILAFIYIPIGVLITFSFNESRASTQWTGFTLDWYKKLFNNEQVIDALMNSLTIAITVTVISTVLGTLCAIALHRYKFRMKTAISGLVYLPILVPDLLMGLSMLILFTQLGMELGTKTVMIAHITFCISFAVVVISARLSGMGEDMEEAANDLGATPWQTFRHITLPTIAPGIIAAALLTFTLSIDDFVISFFVSGPGSTTLPVYIYGLVKKGISPEINALSTILIVSIVFLMCLSEVFNRKGDTKGKGNLPF